MLSLTPHLHVALDQGRLQFKTQHAPTALKLKEMAETFTLDLAFYPDGFVVLNVPHRRGVLNYRNPDKDCDQEEGR